MTLGYYLLYKSDQDKDVNAIEFTCDSETKWVTNDSLAIDPIDCTTVTNLSLNNYDTVYNLFM